MSVTWSAEPSPQMAMFIVKAEFTTPFGRKWVVPGAISASDMASGGQWPDYFVRTLLLDMTHKVEQIVLKEFWKGRAW